MLYLIYKQFKKLIVELERFDLTLLNKHLAYLTKPQC